MCRQAPLLMRGNRNKALPGLFVAPPTTRNGHIYHLESETEISTLSGPLADWFLTRGRRSKVQIKDRHGFSSF